MHVGKYYPPHQGGMETVLENLVMGLLEANHQVSVVVAGDTGQDEHMPIPGPHGAARLIRLANLGVVNSQPLLPGLWPALRRELIHFKPDLVHLHFPNPLLAMVWNGLMAGRSIENRPPHVIWHHADITRQKWAKILAGPVVDRCLDQASGVCLSSQVLLEGSSDLHGHTSKTRVIPFGIAPEPWSTVQPTLDGPFLFVGRLVRYKGLDILLKAVASLPEVRATLVGEGPLKETLIQQVKELGLQDRVQLTGPVDQPQLLELMSRARALVLPSVDASETFGLVQLEAMAAGLPVIASDLPTGVRQVGLPDKSCLLVQPRSVEALAQALHEIQNDSALARAMGNQGRRHFLEKYTRSEMTAHLISWYEDILQNSGKGRKDPA